MVAFGDFGKIFFGGKTTQELGEQAGSIIGGYFGGETGAKIGGNIGADFGKDLGEIGNKKVDVSGPPAGVDSAATLSNLSQTSGFMSTMPGGDGFGTNTALIGLGGVPGALTQFGKQFFKSPGSSALTGFGLGEILDLFINEKGETKKLVITRKLQRDVKKLFMMSGGNFNMTAELYRMATGRQITPEQVVKIITKTFKNQGPYVTKAAVRKTRATFRKMEALCDLKDRMCPPKRRAPARRRTMSTSITQVK